MTAESSNWQASASIEALKKKAVILQKIRHFFEKRNVLEVDTPAMSHAAVTDLHLHAFNTQFVGQGYANGCALSLVTSPEFHMKRLLASGSGCIYQMNKAFRNEECGRLHNPEFIMLEWYRIGFDHFKLMDEVEQLAQEILAVKENFQRYSYQDVFIEFLAICPFDAPISDLREKAITLGLDDIAENETCRDTLLELLFSTGIEPHFANDAPVFVYHFPASQAALSKISQNDERVSERFELYYKGVELANGFNELTCAQEQMRRFEKDNAKRLENGRAAQIIDQHLLSALKHGMPECAGVALGVDRLIMLALNEVHIQNVMAFDFARS